MTIKSFVFVITAISATMLNAQYSSMDFGFMRMNYRNKGPFHDAWWPGVTINLAGFTFSRYSGEVPLHDTVAGLPKSWKPHGNYWNVGFTRTFTEFAERDDDDKRPFITPYATGGFGGWRTHESGPWMTLMAGGGATINLINGVALVAGVEAGKNFNRLLGVDFSSLTPLVENSLSAFPRFYLNPRLALRVFYHLGYSIEGVSSSRERYHAPGWHEYTYESDGFLYSGRSYSDGGSWSDNAIVTTGEYVSISPVVYLPRSFDGVGVTQAYGGQMALRIGLLAADIRYTTGKIGFQIDAGSSAGAAEPQHYWDYTGKSFSVGLNAFNLFAPFRGPSVYRFIVGRRFGRSDIKTVFRTMNAGIMPVIPDRKNLKMNSFFMAAEFGRFGLSWDYLKDPDNPDFKTGGLLGAYYMIPLIH